MGLNGISNIQQHTALNTTERTYLAGERVRELLHGVPQVQEAQRGDLVRDFGHLVVFVFS